MTEKQVEKIMRALDCSWEEAMDVVRTDELIDKGKDPFPLTPEQKKLEKKMRQADRKKNTTYKFTTRERKKNELKTDLITEIAQFLEEKVENLAIPNEERMISFEKDGKKFELTLIQKRK